MDFSGQQQASTIQQPQDLVSAMTSEMATPLAAVSPMSGSTEHSSQATVNVSVNPLLLLEARMNSMSSTIVQWKHKAAALQETVTARETQIAVLQQGSATLEQQVLQLLHAKSQLNDKLASSEQTVAEYAEKVTTLEQEETAGKQQMQQLSAAHHQLIHKTTGLEKTIADYEAYIVLLEQENAGLKQQLDEFSGTNNQILSGLHTMLERFSMDDDMVLAPPSASVGLGFLSETAGNA